MGMGRWARPNGPGALASVHKKYILTNKKIILIR